jgi:hypothetical protein
MSFNIAQIGFGSAVLAGLILAFIGHPEPQVAGTPAGPAATAAAPNAPPTFVLKSVSVELPVSEVAFPTGPDVQAITGNCLSCHSAGMVLTQPTLSKAAWAGIVDKMIHAYKAPVDSKDAAEIVDYLAATKGTK